MKTIASSSAAMMSAEAFSALGESRIAYIKAVQSDEVAARYPGAPALPPGGKLFALHAADGTPIMLSDSREAALAGAASHALETLSVH
jgi:hypothetical protein